MSCLSGDGYLAGEEARATAQQTAATMRGAVAAVIAVDNAMQLIENYQKQKDVAKRANRIKKAYQDMLSSTFWPRDRQFLNEFSKPKPIEEVEAIGRRYAGRLAAMAAGKFAKAIAEAKCNLSRFCTSSNKKVLQDLLLARSNALASARVAGRQMAFAEWRELIDMDYQRRFSAVGVGQGMMAKASNLYASAGDYYAKQGASLAGQFNSAIGQLGGAIGTYAAAGTRMDSLQGLRQDNTVVYGPSAFGVTNTWDQMTGGGSNTFEPYNIGLTKGLSAYSNLSTIYSSNGEAVLNGSQLINQRDLARSGSMTYVVEGIPVGTVTVNMNDFPLNDYADKDHGDMTQ